MARQGDETGRGMGTMGGLAALFALALLAQMSVPLLGSTLPGGHSGASGIPFEVEASGPHDVVLDDLLSARTSPIGGTAPRLVSGSTHDRVEFSADVDHDGVPERIRYEVRDRSLLRFRLDRGAPDWETEAIASDVEEFRVVFLDDLRRTLAAKDLSLRAAHSVKVSVRLGGEVASAAPARVLGGEIRLPSIPG